MKLNKSYSACKDSREGAQCIRYIYLYLDNSYIGSKLGDRMAPHMGTLSFFVADLIMISSAKPIKLLEHTIQTTYIACETFQRARILVQLGIVAWIDGTMLVVRAFHEVN